jgi:hypothetical protein
MSALQSYLAVLFADVPGVAILCGGSLLQLLEGEVTSQIVSFFISLCIVSCFFHQIHLFSVSDIVLIPICRHDHFFTYVVDQKNKTIYVYDPIKSAKNQSDLDVSLTFILLLFIISSQSIVTAAGTKSLQEWDVVLLDGPKQRGKLSFSLLLSLISNPNQIDVYSCGVFVGMFCYCVRFNYPLIFNNSNVLAFRAGMVLLLWDLKKQVILLFFNVVHLLCVCVNCLFR